jgi:hypothetical protein
LASHVVAQAATRHVVLLFDERVELPGLSALEADLVRTLRENSAEPIEVYREAMDLSRFGSASYTPFLRDVLKRKYENKKIDVAVGVMSPSLNFLLAFGAEIFRELRLSSAASTNANLATASCRPMFEVFCSRESSSAPSDLRCICIVQQKRWWSSPAHPSSTPAFLRRRERSFGATTIA